MWFIKKVLKTHEGGLIMKIFSLILAVAGIGFCIAGFMGHSSAWAGAALCFFAAAMIIVVKRKNK